MPTLWQVSACDQQVGALPRLAKTNERGMRLAPNESRIKFRPVPDEFQDSIRLGQAELIGSGLNCGGTIE